MDRRFSEEQLSEIIRRAAEIASSGAGSPPVYGEGIGEGELRRIAHEIGLPSDAVDAALAEVRTTRKSDLGKDSNYERTFERTIEGDVGDEAYATVVEHFVPDWGVGRGTTKVGSLTSYKCMVGVNSCHVTISQKAGRTTLKVASNAWASIMATFFPATLLSVLSGILIFASAGGSVGQKAGWYAALLVVLWVAAVIGNVKLVRFSNRKVARLADAAAEGLAESADHLRRRLSGGSPVPELEGQREQTT